MAQNSNKHLFSLWISHLGTTWWEQLIQAPHSIREAGVFTSKVTYSHHRLGWAVFWLRIFPGCQSEIFVLLLSGLSTSLVGLPLCMVTGFQELVFQKTGSKSYFLVSETGTSPLLHSISEAITEFIQNPEAET